MAAFEKEIEQAVASGTIPGCVLVASNRDGFFTYNKSFGVSTVASPTKNPPLTSTHIMWIASCTKLATSLSALQLVERGLVALDDPIYTHIPELKDWPILKGFNDDDDGAPIEEPHKVPITLRHLLTHTSGIIYDAMLPVTMRWLAWHKKAPGAGSTVIERFTAPMLFEPGSAWMYGGGIDFAGLLVERVTGQSLEEYMKANLWGKLGITDMTFFPSTRPDLVARTADMTERGADGKLGVGDARVFTTDGKGGERKGCHGGDGIWTSADEYLKILRGLLTADEDEGILNKATVDEFFKPQMGEASEAAMQAFLMDDFTNNAMGGVPKDVRKNWGLGGLLTMADMPSGQKEGTMIWGGLPNLIWFVDRKTGLCGLYAGQVLPTGDPHIAKLARKWEAGIYELYEKSKSML